MSEQQEQQEEFVVVENEEDLDIDEDGEDGGEDDSSTDDERVATDSDDEEDREAIRARRRLEKKERKVRQDEAKKRDKVELDFLRKQNEQLEKRLSGIEQHQHKTTIGSIDNQIKEAIAEAELAEKIIAKATSAGNGDDAVKAMKFRDQAILKAQHLAAQKNQQLQQVQQVPEQSKKLDGPDPRAMEHAKKFIADNKWYDPNGQDEDSAIVLAIDNVLIKGGFDPTSDEYWEELNKRVKKRLPGKFKQTPQTKEPKGGPQMGSGREFAPSSSRREVYINPERKAAMIEAGVWDDPILRNKYIKRYMEYDKSNKQKA